MFQIPLPSSWTPTITITTTIMTTTTTTAAPAPPATRWWSVDFRYLFYHISI